MLKVQNIWARRVFVIALCLFSSIKLSYSQASSTTGREFYFNFLPNSVQGSPKLNVYVTSEKTTSGTVQIFGTQFFQDFTIPARSTIKIEIPSFFALEFTEMVTERAVYLSTHEDITVYAISEANGSSGATMVLPLDALDREYIIHTRLEPSQFSVLSTQNNTKIEITFSNDVVANNKVLHRRGDRINLVLDRGESILYFSDNNMTGTVVKVVENEDVNCQKIAVFAGNPSFTTTTRDGISVNNNYNQLYAVRDWGKEFFAIEHAQSTTFDPVSFLASEDNTTLEITGSPTQILNRGESFEILAQVDHYIRADKPISVLQLTNSGSFMLALSPLKQTSNNILFNIPESRNVEDHYLSMVSPSKGLDVKLDGKRINDQFSQLTLVDEYAFAVLPVSSGTHRLESSGGVVAHAYGLGSDDGFGYGIGGNLGNFEIGIDNLESNLPEGEACAGSSFRLSALTESTILDAIYTSFEWDMGDGTRLTGAEIVHNYDTAGTYTVTLLASKSQLFCSDMTAVRTITVIDPAIDEILGPALICPNVGSIAYQIAGALPDYTYEWFVEGGVLENVNGASVEVTWSYGAQVNGLKAISTSPLGCVSDTVSLTIAYNSILDPMLPIGPSSLCGGFTNVGYNIQMTSGSVYNWFAEGGQIVSGQGTNDVKVDWDGPGTHKIWYTENSTTSTDLCEGTSDELEVVVSVPMSVNTLVQNVTCFGGTDGALELQVNGGIEPIKIEWATGSVNTSITGLAAGEYSAKITDALGCELKVTTMVIEPGEFTGHILTQDAACSGDTGSAEAVITGGTGGYSFFWDDVAVPTNLNVGLGEGNYTLRVVDENGCELNLNYVITVPQPLVVNFEERSPCSGQNDGELFLSVAGGTEPYLYEWEIDPTYNASRLSNLATGEYKVRVTDAAGCSLNLVGSLPTLTPSLNLPNSFSPNGDGMNDEFKAVYNCHTSVEMYIYNRWGNVIFTTDDIEEGWDGRYEGERVPSGSYFYQIAYLKELNGKSIREIVRGTFRVIY